MAAVAPRVCGQREDQRRLLGVGPERASIGSGSRSINQRSGARSVSVPELGLHEIGGCCAELVLREAQQTLSVVGLVLGCRSLTSSSDQMLSRRAHMSVGIGEPKLGRYALADGISCVGRQFARFGSGFAHVGIGFTSVGGHFTGIGFSATRIPNEIAHVFSRAPAIGGCFAGVGVRVPGVGAPLTGICFDLPRVLRELAHVRVRAPFVRLYLAGVGVRVPGVGLLAPRGVRTCALRLGALVVWNAHKKEYDCSAL